MPALNVKAQTTYKDNSKAWMQVFRTNVESALEAMGNATLSRARMTVPFKEGSLELSGRAERQGLTETITFGNESVPYAAYQERGMRADGTHVVRNYTTPGTGKLYLYNAADGVMKEGIRKYLK